MDLYVPKRMLSLVSLMSLVAAIECLAIFLRGTRSVQIFEKAALWFLDAGRWPLRCSTLGAAMIERERAAATVIDAYRRLYAAC